jgi:LppP/LprE lipoprotein
MRILGVVATSALLAVGVTAVVTIAPDGSDESSLTSQAPASTPVPADAKKKKAEPRKPKLTAAQRRQRAAAVTTLREQGYRPVSLADYEAKHTLRVLVGRGDAGQRAFFFAGSEYIGNDAADDSEQIRVARTGNRSVALRYKLYEPGRTKSTGTTRVLFRWDGESLAPMTPIPSSATRHAPVA